MDSGKSTTASTEHQPRNLASFVGDSMNINDQLIQALAEVLPPELEIPLCLCRVPENIESDVDGIESCQAIDSVDGNDIHCSREISRQCLIRPHVRVPFLAVCNAHRNRMRNHQCCPTCGKFCIKGQFNVCFESEPSHLFHIGCESLLLQCPHCGSSKVEQKNVNLEPSPFDIKFNPRLSLLKLYPGVLPGSVEIKETKKGRGNSMNIPASYFDVHPSFMSNAKNQEIIKKALQDALEIKLAAFLFNRKENQNIDDSFFVNAVNANDVVKVIFYLMNGISPDTVSDLFLLPVDDESAEDNPPLAKSVPKQTALHAVAIRRDCQHLAYILIFRGANVNVLDSEGRNPLMYAVEKGNVEIAMMLIKANCNVDTKDFSGGDTALHFAAVSGNQKILTALALACYKKNGINFSEYVECNGEDLLCSERITLINAQDLGGWTPLMWAAEHGHVDAVKLLLHFGAKTGIVDLEANIALHWAAMSSTTGVVSPLLNALEPGEIDSQNKYGDTPLIIACQRKFFYMAELLIKARANAHIRNLNGQTALNIIDEDIAGGVFEWKKFLSRNVIPKTYPTPQLTIIQDISRGRELFVIPVINNIDSDTVDDFTYIRTFIENKETRFVRMIRQTETCSCTNDCTRNGCFCIVKQSGGVTYDTEGRIVREHDAAVEQPNIYECTELCRCPVDCANRIAQKGISFRLFVKKTENKGFGLFAAEKILSGSFICEFVGELISDTIAQTKENDDYLFDIDTGFEHITPFCLDAKRFGNVSRFMNHSCNPNVFPMRVFWDHHEFRAPHVCFFAIRDIKVNEEICFDYGGKFWMYKGQKISCRCDPRKDSNCKFNAEKMEQFASKNRGRLNSPSED